MGVRYMADDQRKHALGEPVCWCALDQDVLVSVYSRTASSWLILACPAGLSTASELEHCSLGQVSWAVNT